MQIRNLVIGVLVLVAAGVCLMGATSSNAAGSRFQTSPTVRAQGVSGYKGDLVVTVPGTVVNHYATLAVSAPAGSSRILVTYPGGEHGLRADLLSAGDLIMIVQMAGARIDSSNTPDFGRVSNLGGAGRYELVAISRADGGLITINPPCGGLINDYDINGLVQIVKVPRYNSLTVNAGASLTAPPWNGSFGGILALDVSGSAVINGEVNLSGRGFRGGLAPQQGQPGGRTEYVTGTPDYGAEKGEGIAGYQQGYDQFGGRYGRGAAANGGGGGTAHNAGGGGGANGDSGSVWNGQGVMNNQVIGASSWTLDPGYAANGGRLTSSSGGGRGGYSYALNSIDPQSNGPDNSAWGGDSRRTVGGLGGRPLEQDPSSRLFLGGGGGGGHQNDLSGGFGGNAGGMIYLLAQSVSGVGQLVSNGNPGQNTRNQNRDGAGGGGAGGTIVVYAGSVNGISAQARGGKGGDQLTPITPNSSESQGPGGGGGGGYVAFRGGTITVDVSGGAGGTTGSPSLKMFPANGATDGASGKVLSSIGSIPYCSGISDLAITNTNNASSVIPGRTVTYTIAVSNKGPSVIYGADVTSILPTGFVPASKRWTCNASTGSTCTSGQGNGDLVTKVNLQNGGVATFTFSALLDPAYVGTVSTVARAAVPAGGFDGDALNNESRDEDQATPWADLELSMRSVTALSTSGGFSSQANSKFVPGTNVTFLIEVTNQGPSVANGFGISNQLPGNISLVSVGCTGVDASCGLNSSVGNLVQFTGMSLGASSGNLIRLIVVGFINPAAVGALSTTASLVIPPLPPASVSGSSDGGFFDPVATTNASRVDGVFTPEANLAISKTNNQTMIVAGMSTSYEIEVTNLGPSDATGFNISDTVPSAVDVISSACLETGGSCGVNVTSGSQVLYTGASLPAGIGRSLRLLVTGTVKGAASGTIANTALVDSPVGATHTDPDSQNNSATDSDQIVQQADLTVSLAAPTGNVQAGKRVTLTLRVENLGPSKAIGAMVVSPLHSSLEAATWTCEATSGSTCSLPSGSGSINTTVDLDLNGRATYVITATVARNYSGSFANSAMVSTPTSVNDPVLSNNAATAQIVVIRSDGPTFLIGDGLSKIILSQPFRIALDAANLKRVGTGNARLSNQTLNLPIDSGAIDLSNGTGEVNHSGGLILWNGSKMVQILSVRIDTSTTPAIVSGLVAYSDNYDKLDTGVVAGRLELAELVMPSSVTYPMRPLAFNNLYYHQATMTMTDNLATLLNFHFGGTNFSGGLSLGDISFQLVGIPSYPRP